MRTTDGERPAYNVQLAVDAEHGLIVAQKVTTESNDERSLLPMAEAAKHAVGDPASLNVLADAGYSNGEQAQACEATRPAIVPHVPAQRSDEQYGEMAAYSTAASLRMTKTATPFAVRLSKSCAANKYNPTKSGWSIWLRRKSVGAVR